MPSIGISSASTCFWQADANSRPDLADFLATRARVERTRLLSPAEARSIRLEAGLSRAAARRFHEDYAAIGLDTRIELVALAEG